MLPVRPRFDWNLGNRSLSLGERTLVMGVLNVTPDSFSDGGLYLSPSPAVAHALRMLDAGADIVDIGADSTRPGAAVAAGPPVRNTPPVSAVGEPRRALPGVIPGEPARPHTQS